jgi:hypothetical protein
VFLGNSPIRASMPRIFSWTFEINYILACEPAPVAKNSPSFRSQLRNTSVGAFIARSNKIIWSGCDGCANNVASILLNVRRGRYAERIECICVVADAWGKTFLTPICPVFRISTMFEINYFHGVCAGSGGFKNSPSFRSQQ